MSPQSFHIGVWLATFPFISLATRSGHREWRTRCESQEPSNFPLISIDHSPYLHRFAIWNLSRSEITEAVSTSSFRRAHIRKFVNRSFKNTDGTNSADSYVQSLGCKCLQAKLVEKSRFCKCYGRLFYTQLEKLAWTGWTWHVEQWTPRMKCATSGYFEFESMLFRNEFETKAMEIGCYFRMGYIFFRWFSWCFFWVPCRTS